MRSFQSFRPYQIVFTSLMFTALLVASLLPTITEAAIAGCRADPLVLLSDGTILDVSVDISTNVENVTEIHYRIHGPRGVALVSAISTPTIGFEGRETFTYIDDAKPGQYITETLVHTTYNNVDVTAYTTFAGFKTGINVTKSLNYQSATGLNGEILRLMIAR